jgi:ATP-binding cassette subfamily F protein 3
LDGRPEPLARGLLGRLLIRGEAVFKPVRVLSGGERSRVALGQVLLRKASCLILDEPTNHLDFQTVEALTQALQSFPGSLVVVSHDRGFVRRVGTKILEIGGGRASVYPGTYDEYVWSIERGAFRTLRGENAGAAPAARDSGAKDSAPGEAAVYRERRKALDKRQRQLESRIAELDRSMEKDHAAIARLNEELLDGAGPATVTEMGRTQERIDAAEAEWIASAEELEKVREELSRITGRPGAE